MNNVNLSKDDDYIVILNGDDLAYFHNQNINIYG